MFIRVKRYKNKDGSVREYLLLCTAKREGKKIKQITLANLGRLDSEKTQKSIETIIENLIKFSKKKVLIDATNTLFADYARLYGPVEVFKALWEKTGLKGIIERFASKSQVEYDLPLTVFAMVLNRLLAPLSKLASHEWIKNELYLEGKEEWIGLQHLYRSLDFLEENAKRIEDALYKQEPNLFNTGVELVFFDTTSIKFYGQDNELMQRGYSKDRRPDLNQVVIGIVLRRDSKPISHYVFSGNTVDVNAFKTVIEDLKKRFDLKRVIFVGDRGIVSKESIELLEKEGLEYIVGIRLKKQKEVRQEVLSRAGRYKKVKEGLFAKEVKLSLEKRYIICLNIQEARKDAAARKQMLLRLKELIKRSPKELIKNRGYKKYLRVKQGSIELNEEKVKEEKRYDGKYVLRTNTGLRAEEVVLAYKELWKIERVFRELKSQFEIQPIYHYVPRRIRGHIFLCFLALLLEWELAKRLKEVDEDISVREVIRDLMSMRVVKLRSGGRSCLVRTELKGKAYFGFKAAGIAVPKRVVEIETIVGTSDLRGISA
jgi:transposase